MGKGQSEVIKALLLIGIMVAAIISYMEMTSSFTSSYEEELVTRSFRQIGTYIVETVNHNQAALSANPTATEAVDYIIVNLDIPKKVGDHYYTIQVKENKFWIYANDDHDLSVEYPKDGFEGYAISGSINSIAENHYLSIGGPSNYLFSSKLFYNGKVIPEVGDLSTTFEYWVIFENANINEVDPEEENPSDVNATLYVGSGTILKDYKMKKATPSKPGIPIPANLDYLTNGKFDDGELFYKQLDLLSAISLDQSQGNYFYYFKCEYQGKTEKFPFDKISGPKIPINLELTATPEYIYTEGVGPTPNESDIKVQVTDRKGDGISGADVRLSTTLGHFPNGNKNEVILSTESNGEISTTLKSGIPGIAKITASTFGVSEEVEVTIHGTLDHISIEYYGGSPVTATMMVKGQSKTFYARGYDSAGLLLGDVEVDWSTTGSLDDTDLDPKDGTIKTTFAPSSEGAGRVVAVTLDGEHTAYTGWITCFVDVYSIKITDKDGIPVGDLTITTADEDVKLYCKGYDKDGIFVRDINADWELVTGSLSFTPPGGPTNYITLNPSSEGSQNHIAHTSGIIRAYTGVFEDYTGTIRVNHHPDVDGIEIYNNDTKPLIKFYQDQGVLHNINADQPVEDAMKDIYSALEIN